MVLAVNTEKICHNDTNIAVLFCFVRKNTRSISKYNNTVLDYMQIVHSIRLYTMFTWRGEEKWLSQRPCVQWNFLLSFELIKSFYS